MRQTVILLHPKMPPLSYRLPDSTPPGSVVEAPLGRRRLTGVVWDEDVWPTQPVAEAKLRDAIPLPLPPLPHPLRQLLDFVARYYLAEPSSVLRMALPQAAFLPPPAAPQRYRLGAIPDTPHPRRRAVLERLAAIQREGGASIAEWARLAGTTPATLRNLVKQGVLQPVAASSNSSPIPPPLLPEGPTLSPAQQQAADQLIAAVRKRQFQPVLLDGVTGAGKTEVYLEAIAAAIMAGGQALVLLPEIALTESWLQRFETRFGFAPTVWHSGLTPAQRRNAFHSIIHGDARVIVGARSALFLAAPDLRLIIVDEAHDPAFKQEEGVHYHGRDVAVMRSHYESCPVVLATATPPLETLEQVARGTYRVLHLPDRHGGATLPDIHLIDLTRTPPRRGQWIAPPLHAAIDARLAAGEQILLFLNRRGYAPLTLCRSCGERIQCPNCTAWLVEHRDRGRLLCHHCGHSIPTPEICPACSASDSLAACGPGVERIAEEVAAEWPDAGYRIATSDVIRTPADMAALVADIDSGAAQILIGTQILAKGHDFPNLTLVGVIDADLGLEGGDLRAAERAFQQIRQVSGRAGRGLKPGEVWLQTWQPQSRVMQALKSGDADRFLTTEREIRAASGMPPFGRLAALILSSEDAGLVEQTAQRLRQLAPAADGIEVWGPAPAPLAMLRRRYRHRLLVHARRKAPLQAYLRHWLQLLDAPKAVRIAVDVDPQSFL